MDSFLNPPLCANHPEGVQCTREALLPCTECYLVQYCTEECKDSDRPRHLQLCHNKLMDKHWQPDWVHEQRSPSFDDPHDTRAPDKYLFGNMPAIDLLNLGSNEGISASQSRDFSILCAASGDLRSIIKTINNLPDDYNDELKIVLNDWDIDIVARNAITLMIVYIFKPEDAVPMIIHLWYSARIPSSMLQKLQEGVLPMVDQVCAAIEDKPSHMLCGKTWRAVNDQTVRVVLTPVDWRRLRSYFTVPDGITVQEATRIRQSMTMAPARKDIVQMNRFLQWPAFRTCDAHFAEDGILLPLSASRVDFDTPNPTFHQYERTIWPLHKDAAPWAGWTHEELMTGAQAAKNDIIGSQFFMLRDMLLKFCERIKKIKVEFRLFSMDAEMHLATVLQSPFENIHKFDRIEVSNLCDRAHLGPQGTYIVMNEWGRRLKSYQTNPHATLLMLCHENLHDYNLRQEEEYQQSGQSQTEPWTADNPITSDRAYRYLGRPFSESDATGLESRTDPMLLRHIRLSKALREVDELWEQYVDSERLAQRALESGLRIRATGAHTLTNPWPFRLPPNATQEEFDIVTAMRGTGFERYIELELDPTVPMRPRNKSLYSMQPFPTERQLTTE